MDRPIEEYRTIERRTAIVARKLNEIYKKENEELNNEDEECLRYGRQSRLNLLELIISFLDFALTPELTPEELDRYDTT